MRRTIRSSPRTSSSVHRRKPRHDFRPALSSLEDRTLLATMIWTNCTGGDWDVASNWVNSANPSDEHVPTASDDAEINISGITVTHSTSASDSVNSLTTAIGTTLDLTNSTLSIAAASTINGAFNLAGGTLTGTGNVTVNGTLGFENGSAMSGTGQTIADGTTVIPVDANRDSLQGRTWVNNGLMSEYGSLWLYESATIVNAAGSTFDFNGPFATIVSQDGSSPTFTNAGTVNGQAGAGNTPSIGVAFTNTSTGAVDARSGGLSLDMSGDETGSFIASSGATLGLDGGDAATLDSGSSVSGSGTVEFNSSVIVQGATTSAPLESRRSMGAQSALTPLWQALGALLSSAAGARTSWARSQTQSRR